MGAVANAAATGTTRDLLVAMRERVADAVDDEATPARDLAALTKRLREIAADIAALDAREQEDESDAANVPDEPFDPAAI